MGMVGGGGNNSAGTITGLCQLKSASRDIHLHLQDLRSFC